MTDSNDGNGGTGAATASVSSSSGRAGMQLGYTPLYMQVRQQLLDKLISGEWQPGTLLPSEQQLSVQMGVSQGTVRKALDALSADRIVVRHQGRGTFVAEHDQRRTLFQFFKIADDKGDRVLPETVYSQLKRAEPSASESRLLGLRPKGDVWRIVRHRALKGRVMLSEQIVLSADRFPGLDVHVPLPNNIYELYERHFVTTVTRAAEQLRAVAASAEDADVLGCSEHMPVLQIDRQAFALNGALVELRRSRCLTEQFHYASDLR
ncbi:GntR family transcriptional regulator [Nitratireductor pacificus]|uniref:GntR family transcriptional regulator n=1 Tax=Nitratireductor pacificus pht-3B TaxID=391937 RepID=K2MCY3_9HYPH|nr:GntR family transcriptional regulator [Nitratireductor pacificus]EKF18605.1 GntR family transcriptional regulator [Nitratireductor pacificus pht-3B]